MSILLESVPGFVIGSDYYDPAGRAT